MKTQTVSRAAAHAVAAKRLSIALGLLLAITSDPHIQQALWAEAFSPRSLNKPDIDFQVNLRNQQSCRSRLCPSPPGPHRLTVFTSDLIGDPESGQFRVWLGETG